MNRVIGMLAAFVVLLLLVSGFMAADNIRLNGEKTALADQYSEKSYQHALAAKQLESVKEQLEAMTLERDELLRQLQDYQPGNSAPESTPEPEVEWLEPGEVPPEDEAEKIGENPEPTPKPVAAAEFPEAAQTAKMESALEIELHALEERIKRLEEILLQAETAAETVENAAAEQPDPEQLLERIMPNAEEIMKKLAEAFAALMEQDPLPLLPSETPAQ